MRIFFILSPKSLKRGGDMGKNSLSEQVWRTNVAVPGGGNFLYLDSEEAELGYWKNRYSAIEVCDGVAS
jgi:hypothetical protein